METLITTEMLPLFKKTHIHSRAIEDYVKTGYIRSYSDDANKRNALRQAGAMYRIVDGELYRYGTEKEYRRHGLRIVIHDDMPEKKAAIIEKCHMDEQGNHYGMNITIKNVTETYFWQGISSHVKMFLKNCENCKTRSKFTVEEWLNEEKKNLDKKKEFTVSNEAKAEIRNLGRVKKAAPPETFFIINAERKVDFDHLTDDPMQLIVSNNIEYVVETLGHTEDGNAMPEVYHFMNVPDIVPIPERFRSREIEQFLKCGTFPDDFKPNQKTGLKGPAAQYRIKDNELYHEGNKIGTKGLRLVIHDDTPALKVKIMVESHIDEDGSHNGLNKTMNKIGENYFWTGMSIDVKKFMLQCTICANKRGYKKLVSGDEYKEEVQKLKLKHYQKMQFAVSETDDTDITQAEEIDQETYNQVIRLIGPNQEITEITVAVVKKEMSVENETQHVQIAEVSEMHGEETDNASNVNVVEDGIQNIKTEDTGNESEDIVIEAMDEQHDDAGVVNNTSLIHDMENFDVKQEYENKFVEPEEGTGTVDVVEGSSEVSIANNIGETSREDNYEGTTEQRHNAQYFEDIVYVPKFSITKAILEYLQESKVAHTISKMKLHAMAESFELVDGVLYRRASRYKGRVIVIHDDSPQLKLKLIKDLHIKRNGAHKTELVTSQTLSFQYYWEESKWDVHRFFVRCPVCVKNGVEVKTQKRVMTTEEKKMKINEQREKNHSLGINAQKSREFRDRYKQKLETFKNWEKYGKHDFDGVAEDQEVYMKVETIYEESRSKEPTADGQCQQQKLDGTDILIHSDVDEQRIEDESDVEVHIPESDDDQESTPVKKQNKPTTVRELYRIVMRCTLDQNQAVREMFETQGWSYQLEKMQRLTEAKGQNLYLITLNIDQEEERAIRALFQSKNWEFTLKVDNVQNVETSSICPRLTREKPDIGNMKQKESGGLKREAAEMTSSISEGRRTSKREIKRPRRFSPDSSAVRIKLDVKNECLDKTIDSKEHTTTSKLNPCSQIVAKNRNQSSKTNFSVIVKSKNNVKSESLGGQTNNVISNNESDDDRGDDDDGDENDGDEDDGDDDDDFDTLNDDMDDVDYDEDSDADDREEGEINTTLATILLNDGLETQEVVKTDNGFMCSLCKAVFDTERQCVQHGFMSTCYDECGLCGKMYTKKQLKEYMKHVLMHEKAEKFSCNSCEKVFFEEVHLRIHQRIHNDEKPAHCSTCFEQFYTSFQLASHSIHKHKEMKLFTCDACNAKFVNISFMKSEILFDGELSFFRCIMCTQS